MYGSEWERVDGRESWLGGAVVLTGRRKKQPEKKKEEEEEVSRRMRKRSNRSWTRKADHRA